MSKQIVIIEDDADLLEQLTIRLQNEGFSVIGAETGLEVVNDIVGNKPDLILLDLNLPDLNGDIVARVFKKKEIISGVPIIIMSGKEKEELQRAVETVGAVDYIEKPFDNQELVAMIHKYTG